MNTLPTDDTLECKFQGDKSVITKLIIKTTLLTLITVGIYRFWAKMHLRKFYWNASSIDDEPLEFTGTGMEMFLGFLIAMIILSVYVGVVYMGVHFIALAYLSNITGFEVIVQIVLFIALLPLLYYASYRARRYLMARTRWRGIRLGVDPAAWAYAWRAVGWLAASVISLGLIYPYARFKLQKFLTDRTYFGDLRFTQNGKVAELYVAWLPIYIGAIIFFASPALGLPVLAGLGILISAFLFLRYRIIEIIYFTNNKMIGQDVTLSLNATSGQAIWIMIKAYFKMSLAFILFSIIIGGIIAIIGFVTGLASAGLDQNSVLIGVLMITIYLPLILIGVILLHRMLYFPVLGYFINNITINNASEIDTAHQRAKDNDTGAEGFADALDVGAAF